jgi:hypothetical protein
LEVFPGGEYSKDHVAPNFLQAEADTIRGADPAHRNLEVNLWSTPGNARNVRMAAAVANLVGFDVYPFSPAPNPNTWHLAKASVRFLTAQGRRPMLTELQADDWSQYKVRPGDVTSNMTQAAQAGFKDVLLWRQDEVAGMYNHWQHDAALDAEESRVAHHLPSVQAHPTLSAAEKTIAQSEARP